MAKKASGPKSTAWDRFSQWVRVRDCLKTTGLPFVGVCITCVRRYHISYLQAGHCFAGRKNGHLFHKEFVNAQCTRCNEMFHGQSTKYRKVMDEKYGKDKVDEMKAEADKAIHDRDMDFPAIAKKYQELTNELLGESYEDMLAGHSW